MTAIDTLRKLAADMRSAASLYAGWADGCSTDARAWASTLDSAIRLLGEGEPGHAEYIVRLLVAAGFVSPEKIEQASEIASKFAPVPPAVVVPEGMALVPIEPTEAMCWAGWRAPGKSFGIDQDPVHAPAAVYRAMLNARREPTNG